jgi:hypothetical protein
LGSAALAEQAMETARRVAMDFFIFRKCLKVLKD